MRNNTHESAKKTQNKIFLRYFIIFVYLYLKIVARKIGVEVKLIKLKNKRTDNK